MGIEKDIAIHSKIGVKQCVEYIDDEDKCRVDTGVDDVDSVLSYASNELKTLIEGSDVLLTSGIHCTPRNASNMFSITARKYNDSHSNGRKRGSGGSKLVKDHKSGEMIRIAKESVEAYHVIQSFPQTPRLDPKLVHKIGLEYARAAFPNHQCVVSTHMNTDHLHNHIVVCAYEMEGRRKLPMNMAYREHIRHINDELSIKYNLPILIGNENRNQVHYDIGEKHATNRTTLFKDTLRKDIEKALGKDFVCSWNDFKIYMKSLGYDIRETGKNVTYMKGYKDADGNEKTHRCRDFRLGDRYLRSAICREKGWDFPEERQQTRYVCHLKNSYEAFSSKNDMIFTSDKTGRLTLHVDRYDENGRRRSMLEIALIGAITIIRYFWSRHAERMNDDPNPKDRKEVYMDPNDKLTMMLEALEIARVYGIDSRDQLKERKNDVGRQISSLGRDIFAAEAKAVAAIKEYDGLDGEHLSPGEDARYAKIIHNLADECSFLHARLDTLNGEYALLSKLSRALTLTKDYRFVLGPGSYLSEYPKFERVNDSPSAKVKDTHDFDRTMSAGV